MKNLNFQTTRKTYKVNDNAEISFDPADAVFASSVVKAFQNCSEITKRGTSKEFTDVDQFFDATKKMDADIRKEIDAVFGEDSSAKIFDGSSTISIADGLPVWMNFLMAVIDEIDNNLPKGVKRSRDRVRQYMSKYENKYGKNVRK